MTPSLRVTCRKCSAVSVVGPKADDSCWKCGHGLDDTEGRCSACGENFEGGAFTRHLSAGKCVNPRDRGLVLSFSRGRSAWRTPRLTPKLSPLDEDLTEVCAQI